MDIANISAETFIDHVRQRRLRGVKPETALLDLQRLRVVFWASRGAIGHSILPDLIDEALARCEALDIAGKAERRERRPTELELSLLDHYFPSRRSGGMPMRRTSSRIPPTPSAASCLRPVGITATDARVLPFGRGVDSYDRSRSPWL